MGQSRVLAKGRTGTVFFITGDGYLISNYHVVKGAAKLRLLTGAGLIDASVVKVDAANDLAFLKAVGRFAPLPILPSRSAHLGDTVATIGFPDPSLQGFSPKVLAHGHHGGNRHWEVELRPGDDPRYFQISVVLCRRPPSGRGWCWCIDLVGRSLLRRPDIWAARQRSPTNVEDVVKSAQDAAVLVLVY